MKIADIWMKSLVVLTLVVALGSCFSLYPFFSFSNKMPSNIYESAYVTETDVVRLVGTWTGTNNPRIGVQKNVDGVITNF